jgi:hypothetical protein
MRHSVRLIESTGKAFDRNAIATTDKVDSLFFVDYSRRFVLYIDIYFFFIDE